MAQRINVEFLTEFTGDLTDIMVKLHEYKVAMQDLTNISTTTFKGVTQSVKLTGDEYRATLSGVVSGTPTMVEVFRSFNSQITGAGRGLREFGLNISGVMGSVASFGQIIANLQMPMIWMQWREEQLMVTTRRLRELTNAYHDSLVRLGPANKQTIELAHRLNEERALASVYTQRLERAQLMMNIAYATSAAQIFPALVSLYDILNRLAGSRIASIISETIATWKLTSAKMALIAAQPWLIPAVVVGAGALMATMGMMAAQRNIPPTARGQFGGTALKEGFAYIEKGERLSFGEGNVSLTFNIHGALSPISTASEIERILDGYFQKKYMSRGLRAR